MNVDIYVNYAGNCEAAFAYYQQHLGGRLTMLMRHGEAPVQNLPAEWSGKVLHARLDLGNAALLGADVPTAETMRSAYVTLGIETVEEAERVYAALSDGGQIFMPIQSTFFAERFAMLRDRFGTSWMLLGAQQGEPPAAS